MKLPESVLATLNRYLAKFPVPHGEPGEAIEEQVRQWTNNAVEQVVFEHPGEGWGSKRADGGRPQSKDGMANNQIVPGRLMLWDLVTGAGSGQGSYVGDGKDAEDVTGQVFIPKDGADHIGGGVSPQPPTNPHEPAPNVPTSPDDNVPAPIQAFMNAVAGALDSMQAKLDASAVREAKLVELVQAVKPIKPPKYALTINLPFVGRQTITAEPQE